MRARSRPKEVQNKKDLRVEKENIKELKENSNESLKISIQIIHQINRPFGYLLRGNGKKVRELSTDFRIELRV